MSWIDRIFHREPPTPQPPVNPGPPNGGTQAPADPPADPKDTVSIGQGNPNSTNNPNGTTPAGLPGAPSANSGSGVPTTIAVDPATGKPITEAEKKAQAERLRDSLHVIENVGRGVSGDYQLGLEAGNAWAYDFGSNTIIYKADDLNGKSEEYAVGVILQETGRRMYSRQPSAPEFKDNPALDFLNNAVEGPRVCNLQTSKYAGAKGFFKEVYDEDLLKKTEESIQQDLINTIARNLEPDYKKQGKSDKDAHEAAVKDAQKAVLKLKSPVPRHMQFALGMIYDWYTDGKGDMPDWIRDKNAIRALDQCKNDYREAVKLQREIFEKDLTPKEMVDQSKHSEDIVVNKLWPVYKKLLEMDLKDLGQSMYGNQNGQGQQSQQSQGQGQQSQQSQDNGQQSQQSQGQGKGKSQQSQGQGQQSQQSQDKGQQSQQSQGGQTQQSGDGGNSDKADPNKLNQQGGKETDARQQTNDREHSQGSGSDAGVPDPKNMDTSDGGKLDDSKLTDKQRQEAQQILNDFDKQQNRKVESRQQRDAEDGANSQAAQNTANDNTQGSSHGRNTSQIDLPTLQNLLEKKAETEKQVENLKTPYEKYYTMLAPLTDEMAGELKNILDENAEMKYIGSFDSGRKLDMRRAMQSAAKYERTGEYDENIWLRRQDPSKREYDFVFVVDESGSMRESDKWDNLLKGMIMGAEALQELKINFAVVGFSDQPILHKEFKDKYDEVFREQMLAQIQRSPGGGTNDSDGIESALDMLDKMGKSDERIVIVISDGEGKEQEVRDQIASAHRAGIKVIGVGIGAGMEYVKNVYPDCVAVPRINDLPYELCDLIRQQILDGMEQQRMG